MTDDLDRTLYDRLERLAAAVPAAGAGGVEPVGMHKVVSALPARRSSRVGPVPFAAVVAVGLVVAALSFYGPIRPTAPGATDGPATATVVQGDFEVTLRADKSRYRPEEPIEITASLTYGGRDASIRIAHAVSPFFFGILEPVNGLQLDGSQNLPCRHTTLDREKPFVQSFRKSGGFEGSDPLASSYEAFFADPHLRLPAGTWHPWVTATFAIPDCDGEPHSIRAQIEIVVDDSVAATPEPAPSETPDGRVSATDTDAPFSLTLQATKRTYLETEPIDVTGVFTHSGGSEAAVRADTFFPLSFGIEEPVHGLTLFAERAVPLIAQPCTDVLLQPGEQRRSKFVVTGFRPSPPNEAQAAWLADSELHLPPGTWHFVAQSSLWAGGCGGDATTATTLSVVIEIVVLPVPVITNPPPTYPAVSTGPITDVGGVEAIQDDGTFRVRLASPKSQWLAGEPITIEAAATYIGSEDQVVGGHSSSFMTFDIEQLDGELVTGGGAADLCTHTTFWSGVPHAVAFDKGPSYDANDPNAAWYRAFGNSRSFRLTAGTWRIGAYLEVFVPDCGEEAHKFRTDIVIQVVDPVFVGGPSDGVNTIGDDFARGVVQSYAAEHPESFGAMWIDRPLLGPSRIATSWTKDLEAHRAWLQDHIGFGTSFAIYEAEFTEAELSRARDQIHDDLDWLSTIPAALQSLGVTEVRSRVELEVSSAVRDAPERIREHYAKKFGFDPRMFAVTSDGTGAFFVPSGTVKVTLNVPVGGIPANIEVIPTWESDYPGVRCGHGDAGIGFTEDGRTTFPCQAGHWTIGVQARRGDGEWTLLASAEVDVVGGQASSITIEIDRWP